MAQSTSVVGGEERLPTILEQLSEEPQLTRLLPSGFQIVSIAGVAGGGMWPKSVKLAIKLRGGTMKAYLLKFGGYQEQMVSGLSESQKAINETVKGFVPISHGCGLPNVKIFVDKLVWLHGNSVSPNGSFGPHVDTFHESLVQDNTWKESWEAYFTHNFEQIIAFEQKRREPATKEMETLYSSIRQIIIPRLLRPMEASIKYIKPSLLHGALWHDNVATDEDTKEPMAFEPASFYGHNEYDLRNMLPAEGSMLGPEYLDAYHDIIPITPPEEDYVDRLTLYAIRTHLHNSYLHPDYRPKLITEMKKLVERFPPVDAPSYASSSNRKHSKRKPGRQVRFQPIASGAATLQQMCMNKLDRLVQRVLEAKYREGSGRVGEDGLIARMTAWYRLVYNESKKERPGNTV